MSDAVPSTLTSHRRRTTRRPRIGRRGLVAIEIAVPIVLIAVWWFASADSTNPFFPPLATIVTRFQELWIFAHLVTDILPSLGNLLAGFVIGGIVGIILGVGLGMVRVLSDLFAPVLNFWRSIPPVALVPIFVALMGFGNEVRIITITIAALFPTLISTIDGMRALDPQLRDVARVYRLSWSERLFSVYLPAASPRIASGLQVSLQVAFIVMIASEMLGATYGIGALTLLAQQTFAISDMWAGIILLGILGYAVNLLFNVLRDRVLRWYVRSQQIGKEM